MIKLFKYWIIPGIKNLFSKVSATSTPRCRRCGSLRTSVGCTKPSCMGG